MINSVDPTTIEKGTRIAVWDRPVRIVHWLFVLLILVSWRTAEEEMMEWHYRSGMALLGLLVFRVVWGLIGSSTARFSSFVRGPRRVLSYMRGDAGSPIGHNPLGALSVLALLGMTSLQVALGLFAADEDGLESGPLARFVDGELAEDIAEWHETNFDLLVILIGLHVAAIAAYLLFKRKNLVTPMVSGIVDAPPGTEPMIAAGAGRFFTAAAVAFGVVSLVWSLA